MAKLISILVMVVPVLAAYFAGSFPTAYLLVRAKKGIDIRRIGSGNPGSANVATQLGFFWGAAVGVIDAAKGFLVVLLTKLFHFPLIVVIAVALAAVAGHCWPVFLGFEGGQGLGTSVGVLIPLLPRELVVTVVVGGAVGLASRFLPRRGWFQKKLHWTALAGALTLFVATALFEHRPLLRLLPVLIAGLLVVRQLFGRRKRIGSQ